MLLGIAKLEEFFEAKFEPQNQPPDICRELIHFDGFVHWHLMLMESKRLLRIAADQKTSAFPTVELEIRYSDSSIQESSLMQGGLFLMIRPQGCVTGSNLVVLSRKTDGRISLSTSVGDSPPDECNPLSSDWFENGP